MQTLATNLLAFLVPVAALWLGWAAVEAVRWIVRRSR